MCSATDVGVIIAVKKLSAAKTRLAPLLSGDIREHIVLAMLVDTIAAVHGVSGIASVTVVTPDPDAVSVVRQFDATVMSDPTPGGHPDPLNNAVTVAWRSVVTHTPNVLVLQGDLPAVKSTEIAGALMAARTNRRSFVADRHHAGTSALFAFGCPPAPRFGADSARRHRNSGAVELIGDWPGLRCDIDTPDDLLEARLAGLGPASSAAIESLGDMPGIASEHRGNTR